MDVGDSKKHRYGFAVRRKIVSAICMTKKKDFAKEAQHALPEELRLLDRSADSSLHVTFSHTLAQKSRAPVVELTPIFLLQLLQI